MNRAEDRPIVPVIATATGMRRRPSGEPPPLPRHIARSTRWYLLVLVAAAGLELALAVRPGRRWITRGDDLILRLLVRLRSDPVVEAARLLQHLEAPSLLRAISWSTIALLLITRRFRHLLSYLAIVLTVALSAGWLALLQGRMRPAGISILGSWSGYAHPAAPVAGLAAALTGVLYTAIPRGRWRNRAKLLAAGLLALLSASRLILGVDRPTDLAVALALGWALPIVGYRLLTPDEAFGIHYRRTAHAHLDIGGQRGAAIVQALDQQLGIRALSVEPFGLAGSAGSTPLRIRTGSTGGKPATLFAKLYAINHLRSDRSYKLARMILYGRLEDEKPFSTVRRLSEYEDHLLRLLRDAGLPVPEPYGLVEITPEREYLIVMGFFEGAGELGTSPIGVAEIDSALGIVGRLWRAGVAHRDLKPSNLLVRDGQVLLIDVAFATVRPTPWRQAVDLANMMLTLALASNAELVYQRAIRLFAPEDVAEAFAASRSVTIPTQLRARLRASGTDLVGQFRALAPHRPAVAIQLWTLRRVAVTVSVLLGVLVAAAGLYAYLRLAGLL